MKKVIILCLFLFACNLGPDYQQPNLYSHQEIQEALNLKPTSENHSFSYSIFNDNTLNKLIKIAFDDSPTIKQAISRIKQSRLLLLITEVQGLPEFDIKGSYQYVKESKNIGYVLDEDIYQLGLDASWEIDIFGSKRKSAEKQAANVMQTLENLNNVYVSLSSEIALSYIAYRQMQEEEKLVKKQIAITEQILQENKSLLKTGLSIEDDVSQAIINLNKYKSNLLDIKNNILKYKLKLSLLCGTLPNALDKVLSDDKDNLVVKPVTFKEDKLFNLPSSVIQNRPDVKYAEYELIAQNASIGVALADMFPKVNLSAMVGFQALHIDKLFTSNSKAYSYEPVISVPVFYFGQLKNKLEIEKEAYNEYLANYEETFLTAVSEIKDAMNGVQNTFKQYHLMQEQYNQTYLLYLNAKQRFNAGLTDKLTLLSVQLNFLDAKKNLMDTNAQLYNAVITFFKSIGTIS